MEQLERNDLEHPGTENERLLRIFRRCGGFLFHHTEMGRGQGSVLRTLMDHPGSTQKQLQELLHIQAGSLSETLTRLEQKGLVTRSRDPEDGRCICVSLTEAGVQRVEARKGACEELFTALNAEEKATLYQLLHRLAEDWETRFGGLPSHRDRHHGHRHGGPKEDRPQKGGTA